MSETHTYRRFTKMHGLGNDFVIFDARKEPLEMNSGRAAAVADRKRGVGCDQLIVLRPGERADVFMEIWNADGSRVGACGNATRCVGDILIKETSHETVSIETDAGLLNASVKGGLISVNMGTALTDWQAIPLSQEMNTVSLDLASGTLSAPGAVNMGNPHAVFFVDGDEAAELEALGHDLEHHSLFPERANITVATVTGDRIRARVWERGVGITEACGTAACATLVAAHRKGLVGRSGTIELDGGDLEIEWLEDGTVQMTGPATYVFEGEVRL